MAEPILRVRGLRTHFLADEGVVRAVDGTSFDLYPGRTLGIVGESGCGKSVTARSILRIVERPGRIVGGEILLRRRDGSVVDLVTMPTDGAAMRQIRGGDIGLVFQEPMSSLSAFHTVGTQLIEAIRLHAKLSKKAARELDRAAGDGRDPSSVAARRCLFVRIVGRVAPTGDGGAGAGGRAARVDRG